jgi:PAS domain S-box-containing protein
VYELGNGQLGLPELRTLIENTPLEPGRSHSVEVEHLFPELGYKALRVTARRLRGDTGDETLILLSILDVTEQKRTKYELQACEDKYRTLVDTAQDGIWTIDHSGITTFANASMAAMLATTPGRMIGEPSFEYVFEDDRARAAALFGKKMAGDREPFEFRLRRSDGSWFWVSAVGAPFHTASGESAGLLGTFRDITERKLAEEAALRYADEIARSSADLQHFAHVRSHDLREPLRTMRAYAQLMKRRYAGRLDSEADAFLEFIAGGAETMDKLVTDLLSYSTAVERDGSATTGKVNLKNSLDWAQKNLQTRISQAGAQIDSGDLPAVYGDELQLVQLFQHLLSNSLKFRRLDDPPRVRISAELQGNEWIIAVTDNGIGIPREYWDQVFGIFKRLHGREIPGTGIGLAICRKITENHRGRIWVDSEPGRGATFFFSIPTAQPSAEAA